MAKPSGRVHGNDECDGGLRLPSYAGVQ